MELIVHKNRIDSCFVKKTARDAKLEERRRTYSQTLNI